MPSSSSSKTPCASNMQWPEPMHFSRSTSICSATLQAYVPLDRWRIRMTEFESVNFFTDRSIQDDPYDYFEWVRRQSPVWRDPAFGLFMVTGLPEAMAVYGDPATFPPNEPATGTYSSCNVVSGPFV